jgi:8-oxo-dGTP pyrophosphatase MutT (NUDIX family)
MHNDRPEYLLLRRAEGEAVHPGIWQIVTGTMEPGEKAVDAALRELREETGAHPFGFWVVPFVNAFYDPRRDTVNLIPFFAGQIAPDSDIILSPEHVSFAWHPLHQACSLLVWPGQRQGLETVHQEIVAGREASRLIAVPL